MCAETYKISRHEQDEYSVASFKRAKAATEAGLFKPEIVPVPVPQKKGDPVLVTTDEQFTKVDFNKMSTLKSPFKKDGTLTTLYMVLLLRNVVLISSVFYLWRFRNCCQLFVPQWWS